METAISFFNAGKPLYLNMTAIPRKKLKRIYISEVLLKPKDLPLLVPSCE